MLARVSLTCLILASNKQFGKDRDNEVIENLMFSEVHGIAV